MIGLIKECSTTTKQGYILHGMMMMISYDKGDDCVQTYLLNQF